MSTPVAPIVGAVEVPGAASGHAAPPAQPGSPAPVASTKPMNVFEVIAQEIENFFRQREEAVSRVHAIEGAIQASTHLLNRMRAEEAKAVAAVKAAAEKAETEANNLATVAAQTVAAEATKVEQAVKTEVAEVAQAVEKEVQVVEKAL